MYNSRTTNDNNDDEYMLTTRRHTRHPPRPARSTPDWLSATPSHTCRPLRAEITSLCRPAPAVYGLDVDTDVDTFTAGDTHYTVSALMQMLYRRGDADCTKPQTGKSSVVTRANNEMQHRHYPLQLTVLTCPQHTTSTCIMYRYCSLLLQLYRRIIRAENSSPPVNSRTRQLADLQV